MTSACARARRTLCRLVLAGTFCLFGWAALAVVDADSAAASEHSAGGVELGRAEHGGPLTAVFDVDAEHATTGVEARRPARQATVEPAQRADGGTRSAAAPADDADDTTTPAADEASTASTSAQDAAAVLGDEPAGTTVGGVTAPLADTVAPRGGTPRDGDSGDTIPVAADAAPATQQSGTAAPIAGDAAPIAEGSVPITDDAAPVAGDAAPTVDDTAPVADGAAPVTDIAGAVVAGSTGDTSTGGTSTGGPSTDVEDVAAPVAGIVRQLGVGVPAGGGDSGDSGDGTEWGGQWSEAAAPIVDFFEQIKSATEALPKPGDSLLPEPGDLLPGSDDPEGGVPSTPGNDDSEGDEATQSGAGSTDVAPVTPGLDVLPMPRNAAGMPIAELAGARAGVVERPGDDLPAAPRRGELPVTLNVGSVPNTSNGGAGNGPAAQDTEPVGAASEQTLLGVARTSDGRALTNDGQKPPVSPD